MTQLTRANLCLAKSAKKVGCLDALKGMFVWCSVSIWSLTVGFKPAGSFAGWYRSAFEGWIGGYCCHTLRGKPITKFQK